MTKKYIPEYPLAPDLLPAEFWVNVRISAMDGYRLKVEAAKRDVARHALLKAIVKHWLAEQPELHLPRRRKNRVKPRA